VEGIGWKSILKDGIYSQKMIAKLLSMPLDKVMEIKKGY
jgi:hypothetical protein